jgi:hypothetical protein
MWSESGTSEFQTLKQFQVRIKLWLLELETEVELMIVTNFPRNVGLQSYMDIAFMEEV